MNDKRIAPSETEPSPPPAAATQPAPPDKMAPFRALFGMPVAVQFIGSAPYLQIAPLTDQEGNVQAVQVPNTTRVIGLPSAADPQSAVAVATGVLGHTEDGTWLIIEERIGIPRTGQHPAGQALMDIYVRPEFVTHISFVKAIEFLRRPGTDAEA